MPKDSFEALCDHKSPPTYYFFDGEKWTPSHSGKTADVVSPVNGELIGRIQSVTPSEIDSAITRAKQAQKKWFSIPLAKRGQILRLASDWVRHHEQMLSAQLTTEIGKTFSEAKDEILRCADMIDYFVNAGLLLHGEELEGDAFAGYDQSKMAIVERWPLGIVLAISPFNYPLNLSVSKIAPALIMGNSVVFKPSTQGSILGIMLTEIFRLSGVPDGVLVTLTGTGDDIGDYLVTHKDINMIAFTGTSKVGKSIAAKAGMIPLLFECGGNNPAIVLPDADLTLTAGEIVQGAFSYAGQRCTAIKYVLGLPPTLDQLIPKVVEKTKTSLKTGDPRIQEHNLGPVISDHAAQELEKRVLLAKADGATLVYGGSRNGCYFVPIILDNAKPHMEIVSTETFGPVVSFVRVPSIDEAVKIINAAQYGLQACIFTKDEGTGIVLGKQLEVGSIQLNNKPQRGPDHFPFLGIKGSGVGVQGISYALEAMSRPKSIVLNKPQ